MDKAVERRRGLRVAGHPAHPMLVHFPVAFLTAVFPLELLGFLGWPPSGIAWTLAYWAQASGLVFSLPAAFAGLMDLPALTDRPKASALANLHMGVILGAIAAAGLAFFLKAGSGPIEGLSAFVNLGLSLSSLVLLAWGGWLGGELVYRHGAAQEQG